MLHKIKQAKSKDMYGKILTAPIRDKELII